jgi:hypothetical protein
MADSIWWTKMLHKDFCAHYCEMSDSEIVADVRRSVASLMMQRSEGSDFGALMVRIAMERIASKHDTAVSNGMQGGRPRKETTADATTREDVEFKSDSGDAGDLESATSANHYGDAATSDGEDASTTVSRNMRRVPQNEAPAHGFSGGRTAQCTMSSSTEAAAQSGKDYDQETCQVSTDEARESQALVSRRTEGHSLRVGNVARTSVRSPGRKFRNKEEFIQWAIDTGLDPVDANECWEATEERGGKDADGNTVKNIKAFARQWCKTRAEKRRTA